MHIPPTVTLTPRTIAEIWESSDARGRAVLTCARAAYEAIRAYRAALGESDRGPWELSAPAVVSGYCNAVEKAIGGASPAEQHAAWLADKLAQGWSYGLLGSDERRESPNMVPYTDLPEEQRWKDQIVAGVVGSLAAAMKLTPAEQHAPDAEQYAHAPDPTPLRAYPPRHVPPPKERPSSQQLTDALSGGPELQGGWRTPRST